MFMIVIIIIDLTITLMTLLAGFAMADHDVCYEGINTITSGKVYYNDGAKITFTIGIDVDPIQFICRPRNGTQRYFASVSTCGEVSNSNGSSVNINETGCDTNCHSYVITPIDVECILLKCERDLTTNSNSTNECLVYINISEISLSQSTFTASVNTRSLGSANKTEIRTVVAICAVIAAVLFVGSIIYLSCKGLQRKRRSCDIEDQGRPPDMNGPAVMTVSCKNDNEIQSIDSNSTEVVVGNEVTKVANPENHEKSDTTDVITSTRLQRMAPHSRVQRGYESEIKVYEEETMRESVKSASITLGEMSEDTVTVVLHYQETDKNSNAYYFSTMTGKQHHPNGNAGPIVKTVLQENEVTWICTK